MDMTAQPGPPGVVHLLTGMPANDHRCYSCLAVTTWQRTERGCNRTVEEAADHGYRSACGLDEDYRCAKPD